MDLVAGKQTLLGVVSTFELLEVDDYQRPYTWEKGELGELFEDLEECVQSGENHFFGTLILQEGDKEKHAKVVDGQQRLTTSMLLVAALRDELLKIGNPIIPAGHNRVQTYVPALAYEFLLVSNKQDHFRFSPNRNIKHLMEKVVWPETGQDDVPERDNETTRKFRKAIKFIRKYFGDKLSKLDTEMDRLIAIHNYLEALLKRFQVLTVPTYSDSESLDIFLTLNNRGVPLGPSDLVRGEVLKRTTAGLQGRDLTQEQKRNFDKWTEITNEVKDPEGFLRHYLVATHVGKVQKKKVIETVLKRIKGIEVPFEEDDEKRVEVTLDRQQVNARAFWDDLADAASIYGQIINPWGKRQLDKDSIAEIHMLNGLVRTHRILLLNVLRQRIGDAAKKELIHLIFVYVFLTNMNDVNAQKQEDEFQKWGQEFAKNPDVDSLRCKLQAGIEANPVNVEEFFAGDADDEYVTRALLYMMNHYMSRTTYELKKYHLEHIAPQTSTDYWEHALGVDSTPDGQITYASLVSKLGNLTLLDPEGNWKIQNFDFKTKKDEGYFPDTTVISRDLCDLSGWETVDISDRTRWLLDGFRLIWNATPVSRDDIERFSRWRIANSEDN